MVELLEITEDNFEKEVRQAKLPVIILCQLDMVELPKGVVALYQSKFAGEAIFGIYRVGDRDDFATSIQIRIVPSILIYKSGKEIGCYQPVTNPAKLVEEIKKIIQKNPL